VTVDNIATALSTDKSTYLTSSLGKKIVMALTGVALFGYVVGHLAGNLQIFVSQNQINTYAKFLHDTPLLTWTVRSVLLVALGWHILNGFLLYLQKQASRPVKYVYEDTVAASKASRTMFWTGIGLFLFVVYHLLHFTFISTNPEFRELHDASGRHDVYSMVILGFQNYLISAVYIISVGIVCFHLSHAIRSFFQTLGWNTKGTEPFFRKLSNIAALVIFLGYVSIPVAVLAGVLQLPAGVH
jgi:succinate dehydrogenase / fumarate reductase cytochrome b subunit